MTLKEMMFQYATKNGSNKSEVLDYITDKFSDCQESLDVYLKLIRMGYDVDFVVCQDIYTFVNYNKINELLGAHRIPLTMSRNAYGNKLLENLKIRLHPTQLYRAVWLVSPPLSPKSFWFGGFLFIKINN